MLFVGLWSRVHVVKNCALRLEYAALCLRPRSAFSMRLGHGFSLYRPPSRQITYIPISWNI